MTLAITSAGLKTRRTSIRNGLKPFNIKQLKKPRQTRPSTSSERRVSRIFDEGGSVNAESATHGIGTDDIDSDNQNDDDEERLILNWDEEHTLVNTLLDDEDQGTGEGDKISQLTNMLPQLYADQSKFLREDMIHTILPAIKRVQKAHAILRNQADDKIADGVLAFDAACKRIEVRFVQQLEKTQDTYQAAKNRIAELKAEIEGLNEQKAQLWERFEKEFEEIVAAAEEEYDHISLDGDRIIEAADKKLKKAEKEREGKISKAKLLESMLKKL